MIETPQIHFGAPFTNTLTAVLSTRLPSPYVIRKTVLEGHRWTPAECLSHQIIDIAVSPPTTSEVIKQAHRLAEEKAELAKGGVWGLMKKELFRETIGKSLKEDVRLVYGEEAGRVFKMNTKL